MLTNELSYFFILCSPQNCVTQECVNANEWYWRGRGNHKTALTSAHLAAVNRFKNSKHILLKNNIR